MALKFYAPVEFDDTSSGLTIDGDLIVDTSTLFVDVSTDRVGIGTASPLTYLHVKGTSSGNTFSNLEGLLVETGGSSNSYYAVQVATAGGGKSFNVTNAGNIGIGTTSPAKKLDVNGDSYIRTSGTGQTLLIGRTSSQPTIKADSSNGGYLILDSLNNFLSLNHYVSQNVVANNGGGNFLIGTATNSGYKLDVNGEIN